MPLFEAVTEASKLANTVAEAVVKQVERNNAPEMVENAKAKTEQEIKDDAAKAIAEKNVEEIRKGLAE